MLFHVFNSQENEETLVVLPLLKYNFVKCLMEPKQKN